MDSGKSSEENEFVMIDHPQGDKVAKEDPFLTGKDIVADMVQLVSTNNNDAKLSPFDAVFGVENQEEEPVMVSSFTDDSERSNSTNSSTHRVSTKKPPAPPPQQQQKTRTKLTPSVVHPNEFDAIFGSHNEIANVSETNNNTSQVTPYAKTVPSDQTLNKKVFQKGEQGGRGVKEDQSSSKKGDKKKKKNIVSWAKSFGGFDFSAEDDKKKKKKDKKKAKELVIEPKKKKEDTPTIHSSEITPSQPPAPINNTSVPAFDLDTIQGSHIAELVNMGFEPAAALEALDRYDQDLVKATNFLLDQFN